MTCRVSVRNFFLSREAEIKALQAKKEALQSAGGDSGLGKVEVKEESGKDEVKAEAAPGGDVGAGGLEGAQGEISTASGSPDSGLVSEGVKLDLKGKSDQAKILELQKVICFHVQRRNDYVGVSVCGERWRDHQGAES